ncbi:MAG: ATP-binding protein [Cardiobacteriaceae bacterium]|nr:ATP-binding protein [Cardiobacteriaceae bacterium]
MEINIKQAVNSFFPNHSFNMIYSEAIANALDAGASKIDISISYEDVRSFDFSITDNGEGFTPERYRRFSRIMDTADTSHKGLGRLVYLHYFDDVEVESIWKSKSGYKKTKFTFNLNFSHDKQSTVDIESDSSQTRLTFNNFNHKKISSLSMLSSLDIKKYILSEFLPCFIQLREQGKNLSINISTQIKREKKELIISNDTIKLSDIPEFTKFTIPENELSTLSDKLRKKTSADLFREGITLYYYMDSKVENTSIVTSFAIDNRALSVDVIDKSNYKNIENIEAVFFLSSKMFVGMVDSARQKLTLDRADERELKKILKRNVKTIFKANFPKFFEELEKAQTDISNKYPHLKGYICLDDVGFESKEDILNNARDKFFLEQKTILEKENLTDEDYQKALELSSRNLAEYILFRNIQLDKLKAMTPSNLEKDIHNTIAPKKTFSQFNDYENLLNNNAWILDDRFMSFICSSSDNEIKKITDKFSEIIDSKNEANSNERPDYLLLFSSENTEQYDVVCFEFKRLHINKRDKLSAASQLVDYIGDLRDAFSEKINKAWMYALVDFDEELERTLERNGFKHRFTVQGKIYSQFYSDVDAEINFLDFDALVKDADIRNKTFMDILKKGFT